MSLLFFLKYHNWGGGPNPPDPDVKRKQEEQVVLESILGQRKRKVDRAIKLRQDEEDLLLMLGEFDA